MRLRSGEFTSPLPHIYPVWQHFITEVGLTRKSGHTSARFSQLSALLMGYNISWLCYDTITHDSCFGSVARYYLEFLSTCECGSQTTHWWLWKQWLCENNAFSSLSSITVTPKDSEALRVDSSTAFKHCVHKNWFKPQYIYNIFQCTHFIFLFKWEWGH